MMALAVMVYNNIGFYTLISSLFYRATTSTTTTGSVVTTQSQPQQEQDIESVGINLLIGISHMLSGLSTIIDREADNHRMITSSPQTQPIIDEIDD